MPVPKHHPENTMEDFKLLDDNARLDEFEARSKLTIENARRGLKRRASQANLFRKEQTAQDRLAAQAEEAGVQVAGPGGPASKGPPDIGGGLLNTQRAKVNPQGGAPQIQGKGAGLADSILQAMGPQAQPAGQDARLDAASQSGLSSPNDQTPLQEGQSRSTVSSTAPRFPNQDLLQLGAQIFGKNQGRVPRTQTTIRTSDPLEVKAAREAIDTENLRQSDIKAKLASTVRDRLADVEARDRFGKPIAPERFKAGLQSAQEALAKGDHDTAMRHLDSFGSHSQRMARVLADTNAEIASKRSRITDLELQNAEGSAIVRETGLVAGVSLPRMNLAITDPASSAAATSGHLEAAVQESSGWFANPGEVALNFRARSEINQWQEGVTADGGGKQWGYLHQTKDGVQDEIVRLSQFEPLYNVARDQGRSNDDRQAAVRQFNNVLRGRVELQLDTNKQGNIVSVGILTGDSPVDQQSNNSIAARLEHGDAFNERLGKQVDGSPEMIRVLQGEASARDFTNEQRPPAPVVPPTPVPKTPAAERGRAVGGAFGGSAARKRRRTQAARKGISENIIDPVVDFVGGLLERKPQR